MNYLQKYVGTYRVKAEIDKTTNDFPRDKNGLLCDYLDVWIQCYNNVRIYHYGGRILEVYIPSIIRGHNMVKEINKIDTNLIFDITESDSEVLFHIKDDQLSKIIHILRPITSGASISPFSSKNLPVHKVNKKSSLTTVQIKEYDTVKALIPKDKVLLIRHINKGFLNEILAKKCKLKRENIQPEMKKLCLDTLGYIASKGLWDEYIKYFQKEAAKL